MNLLSQNGAQPQKQTKFTPLHTGRFFNGLVANRSPLRVATASHIYERFYGDQSSDAMIGGLNVEVTNKLTLGRRCGFPRFNATSFSDVLGFDEFRLTKAISDEWGTTTESLYTMVDTENELSAIDSAGAVSSVMSKNTIGKAYMQSIGGSLYISDGKDQPKKWMKTLFIRNTSNDQTTLDTNAYPFMSTFFVNASDYIQQLIGVSPIDSNGDAVTITSVDIVSNVVTVNLSAAIDVTIYDANATKIAAGVQFVLWGFDVTSTSAFLNGATIQITSDYTTGTTLTCELIEGLVSHADFTGASAGYLQVPSGVPINMSANSGIFNSVSWSAQYPALSNNFTPGVTLDGSLLWANRGLNLKNWGIVAPKSSLSVTPTGQVQGYQTHTYYSPASIYIDSNGNVWQITKAGKTGSASAFSGSPTAATFLKITQVDVTPSGGPNGYIGTFLCANSLTAGQKVLLNYFGGADQNLDTGTTVLNGLEVTVATASGTQFTVNNMDTLFGTAAITATIENAVGRITSGTGAGTTSTSTGGTEVWTCIELSAAKTWAAHTFYRPGHFLVANSSLFQLRKWQQPFINAAVSFSGFNSTTLGGFNKFYPMGTPDFGPSNGYSLHWAGVTGQNTQLYSMNGAGEIGAAHDSGHYENWEAAITCSIYIPKAGTYTFSLQHDDGAFFSFDLSTGAYLVSGTLTDSLNHIQTAEMGYGQTATGTALVGNNNQGVHTDTATWYFPSPGNYALEIDYTNYQHASSMIFKCNGQEMAVGPDESGTTQPVWPAFSPAGTGATWDSTYERINWPNTVSESVLQYQWNNLGPIADYVFVAGINYTLPGTRIVDSNSDEEGAYETGYTGATPPVWPGVINKVTPDPNPPLKWLDEGAVPIQPSQIGKITAASAQGWLYTIALASTLDQTVSNAGPLSSGGSGDNGGTGPILQGNVAFAPGAGLDTSLIDEQADYVLIFRTTDGGATPLLIMADNNAFATIPLCQYLANGYVDQTDDADLNDLISAPTQGQNTPPPYSAINLSYHLGRIWYSVGNTVYWTSGATTTVGNGDGTPPGNKDVAQAVCRRLHPVAIGMLNFTVSDIVIIAGNATPNSPILPGVPYLEGIGLSNYNALDVNGSIIGLYTSDKQFIMFNPSAGIDYSGHYIGNLLRLNDGKVGTSWDTSKVSVAWHVDGEDMGWYLCDGKDGYYKLIATPAPESGECWSPFAQITGGVSVIGSVETLPGVHTLLAANIDNSQIWYRSLTASSDGGTTDVNGTTYTAWAIFGSYVLAHAGQIALISFITTDSLNIGSPLILGVLMDEVYPIYQGPFDILKNWSTDPTNLPQSKSILGQRFYMSDDSDIVAVCRHMQVLVQWPAEAVQNELHQFAIFGTYDQEA